MRLRIENGDRSIEVEGSAQEVNSAMERFWTASSNADQAPTPDPQKARQTKQRKRSSAAGSGNTGAARGNSWDPMPLVSKIKSAPDYKLLVTEVLDKKDNWKRCQLVLTFADERLTSGQVLKVLNQLGVKIGKTGTSNAMLANTGDLLFDKARKKGAIIPYELTDIAKRSFADYRKKLSANK